MIQKQIIRPKDLTTELILSTIERHFAGSYKTTRESNSKLKIRRLYQLANYNPRVEALKKMDFKDFGYFSILDDSIIFKVKLGKQILFWITLLTFGVFITWKVWHVSFLLSFILITIPITIVWIIGIIELKEFIDFEMNQLTKRLINKNNKF